MARIVKATRENKFQKSPHLPVWVGEKWGSQSFYGITYSDIFNLVLCRTKSLSRVRLCVTLWTVARQAPLSLRAFRQEYWSRLPYPPTGDLPDPDNWSLSLLPWQAGSLPLAPPNLTCIEVRLMSMKKTGWVAIWYRKGIESVKETVCSASPDGHLECLDCKMTSVATWQ